MKRYERFCTYDTEFLPVSNNSTQVDNTAYKRYLKPGEPYPKGKTIHRGTKKPDARWYWVDPDRKDPELYKKMLLRAKNNLTWKPYPGEEKYKTDAAERTLINTIADICSTYDVEVPNIEMVPTIEHPVLKHLDYSGVYGIVDCESKPIYGPDPRDNSFVKVLGWMPPLKQGTIRLCTGSLKEGASPSQVRYESDPDIQRKCVRILSKDVAKDPLERIKMTVTHELCHAITHKGTRMENGRIVPGERYNKWIEIYEKYNLDQYSGQISDYASWHADEFLSEAFALYVGGYGIPDPVRMALEEYLKEVRR
jgi:hypothetical protein